MNIEARIYYPAFIAISLVLLIALRLVTANAGVGMCLVTALFVMCAYGVSIENASFPYVRSLRVYWRYALGTLSMIFPVALFIKISEILVNIGTVGVSDVLSYKIMSYASLVPMILCIYAIFVLHVFVYRTFIADMDGRYRVLITTTASIAVYTIIYFIAPLHIAPWAFALAMVSYYLMLDLFVERLSASIVWIVMWHIMIATFMMLIIFSANIQLLQAENRALLPLYDGISLFSIIFIISASLWFIVSKIAETFFPGRDFFFLFKKTKLLQDRIQYAIIAILTASFIITAAIAIYYFLVLIKTNHNNQEIYLQFIHALTNAFVFLFFIGFSMVIAISSFITSPISQLSRRLNQIKLSHLNEPIEWKRNDEIGALINEYNSMIRKLESNAKVLAQTERDTAWREMARQVAHEIKNPLTPMKLSLQHMQRTVHNQGAQQAQPIIERMCNTLMEQIDNLSQISDEFSNFATMPPANNSKIMLNEVVETVHDLFRKRDDMEIRMIEPIDDVVVYVDKNNMIRILNNLIKNAIQAIPTGRRGEITIKLYKDDVKAIIEVIDNGIGIPDHMKNKIFKPNFTTKSSGTGLGLAIAANMVESFGGSIYFKSDGQTGTTFYIEIPLNRVSHLHNNKNTVLIED